MKPASHPSHTFWKSLRNSYIPRPRRLLIGLLVPTQLETIATATPRRRISLEEARNFGEYNPRTPLESIRSTF